MSRRANEFGTVVVRWQPGEQTTIDLNCPRPMVSGEGVVWLVAATQDTTGAYLGAADCSGGSVGGENRG